MPEHDIKPFSNPDEVLRLIVETHENYLQSMKQVLAVGPHRISDIKSAVGIKMESIFAALALRKKFDDSGFMTISERETFKSNSTRSLRLFHRHLFHPPGRSFKDLEGNGAELNDLTILYYDEPSFNPAKQIATGETAIEEWGGATYINWLLGPGHQVKMRYAFSLLERPAAGGELAFTGFSDLRSAKSQWGIDAISVHNSDFVEKPTIEKYRYLWRGLRWMCANLLVWESQNILLPEDLDLATFAGVGGNNPALEE